MCHAAYKQCDTPQHTAFGDPGMGHISRLIQNVWDTVTYSIPGPAQGGGTNRDLHTSIHYKAESYSHTVYRSFPRAGQANTELIHRMCTCEAYM